MLITISRQYAAGGSQVARRVAMALGWRLVDNELVERVAERAGVPADEVAQREERPGNWLERLARQTLVELPELFGSAAVPRNPGPLSEAKLVRVTATVVKELAAEGRCVFVGRACAAVLGRRRDAMHVRLVAGTEFRRRVAVDELGCEPEEAERRLQEVDSRRERYHLDYYDRNCNDPAEYDLVLNTERLGWDGAAALVVARARALGWEAAT